MSNRKARFSQADVHRALKAVIQAGIDMAVDILPDGTITIHKPWPAPMGPKMTQDAKMRVVLS